MIKKIIVLLTIIVLLNINICVNASTPYNNKTALAVGVSYSDGTSSTAHANNSYNAYNYMGLTTKKITSTTISNMTSSHSNGTPYLESGIVYLVGHAGFNNMQFINNVVVDKNLTIFGSTIGIQYYDNSRTALITFAGCETAKQGQANIALTAYAAGTAISMGWKTDLSILSYENWNSRFNNKIKDKTTSTLSAAQYASSYIYLFNNVKNYKIYGDFDRNPWYYLNTQTVSSPINIHSFEEVNNVPNANRTNEFLRKKISNIDLNNFKLEINGVHETYYDYVLYVNNIRTGLGYTIVENNKTKELKIIDNMNNYSYNEIKELINSKNINEESINKSRMIIIDKISNENSNYSINNEIQYYDVENDKIYYVIEVKTNYSNGSHMLSSYLEEIKSE